LLTAEHILLNIASSNRFHRPHYVIGVVMGIDNLLEVFDEKYRKILIEQIAPRTRSPLIFVEGDREVMLVDAQLTKASAEKVLQEIKETKKPLSMIYITHEHADQRYPRRHRSKHHALDSRTNQGRRVHGTADPRSVAAHLTAQIALTLL
jgi:hypothetical protein